MCDMEQDGEGTGRRGERSSPSGTGAKPLHVEQGGDGLYSKWEGGQGRDESQGDSVVYMARWQVKQSREVDSTCEEVRRSGSARAWHRASAGRRGASLDRLGRIAVAFMSRTSPEKCRR